MIYLIIYLVMIPINYYLIRWWSIKNSPPINRDWADILTNLIAATIFPIFWIMVLCEEGKLPKPPKWL